MPVQYVSGKDMKRGGLAAALNTGHHGHHMRSMLDKENAVGTRVHVPVYGNGTVDVEIVSYIKKPRRAAHGESGVYAVRPVKGESRLPKRLALKVYGDIEPDSSAYAVTSFMQASILRNLANALSKGAMHKNVLPYYGDFYDDKTKIAAFALGLVSSQTTVSDVIKGRHYTLRDAVKFGSPVFEAVAELGKRGIVHRDIKPQNILQPAEINDGRIVSTNPADIMFFDFDVGWNIKYADASGVDLKDVSGRILGTPGYIPPEMWRGESSLKDTRCDVYSAAVTVFEAVTGQRAWKYNGSQGLLFITGFAAKNYEMPNNIGLLDSVTGPYGEAGRYVNEALRGGLNPDPEKRLPARLIANLFDTAYKKLDDKPVETKNDGLLYDCERLPTICMDEDAAHTVLMQR